MNVLYIALAAISWLPAILGFGALLRYRGDAGMRRAVSGMLGLGVIAAATIVLNFWVPINPYVSLALWVVGTALFFRQRSWLIEGITVAEFGAAATCVAVSVLLMQPPWRNYDAGLYYLQTVKWAVESDVEIGIVNLHGRLAFNSAWHVLCAALEHPLAHGVSHFFVQILPMTFAAAAIGTAMRRVLAGRVKFAESMTVALLVPVCQATEGLASQAPDHALAVVVPFVLALWVRSLEFEDEFYREAFAAVLLSVFAVTIKLSALPLFFGAVVILLVQRRAAPKHFFQKMATLSAVLLLPWLARSVLLSGCLVYPAAATCFSGLRWAPALAAVRAEADWIRSWARAPNLPKDEVLASFEWIRPWIFRVLSRYDYCVLACLLGAGVVTFALCARRAPRALVLPYGVALSGVVYWFVIAPDPRFALGFLFSAAILPLAFAASRGATLDPMVHRYGAILVVCLAATFLYTTGVLRIAVERPWPIPAVTWPATPIPESWTLNVTQAQFMAHVPVDGDQCWIAPLPCTPKLDPRLGRDWAIVRAGELSH